MKTKFYATYEKIVGIPEKFKNFSLVAYIMHWKVYLVFSGFVEIQIDEKEIGENIGNHWKIVI